MVTRFKILLIPFLSICTFIFTNCNNNNEERNERKADRAYFEKLKAERSNRFKIKGEDIAIRTGPGKQFDKIVNQKATNVLGSTHYLTVDYSCVVEEKEISDKWSRIIVVDPSWLTESHKGWIETKYLIKTEKTLPQTKGNYAEPFNDVESLKLKIGNNGIGTLRQWRNDGVGWISSTDYYSFGSKSLSNGMQNNLAYYIESDNEYSVKEIKLILNINNDFENSEALIFFEKIVDKTFNSLKLKMPKGLSSAIKSGRTFKSDMNNYKTILAHEKSRISSWKLIIEAKSK